MTDEELKTWLSTPCADSDIKPNSDGSEYIPIGIIENKLDKFDSWGTSNFKFQIFKTSNYWFASGSVELLVVNNKKSKTINGAVTYSIGRRDSNMDYEATVLSFCIANAAKKLGKQFGRHLNGRLEKGETAFPIILVDKRDTATDPDYAKVLEQLTNATTREDALEIREKSEYKYKLSSHPEAVNIINAKPLKNNNNGQNKENSVVGS